MRAARGLLVSSPRAAQKALANLSAEELLRLATERRLKTPDVNLALADLARSHEVTQEEHEARPWPRMLVESAAYLFRYWL